MNVALRAPMSFDQFLAWEERQPLRYEFDGLQPLAMVGGTVAHSAIQRNLLTALTLGLRDKPCQPYGSDLKVQTSDRTIRYPDALVICTPVSPRAKLVTDPVVIFEIVSESSVTTDLVIKNAEYRAMPSVRRYVILQQTTKAAAIFSRKGEDWITDLLTTDDAILHLPEIALDIPLSEIYRGLDLESPAASET